MARKKGEPPPEVPELERIGVILPRALVADCEDVRTDLRRAGQRVSFSGLVEAALRELIGRHDIAAILRRHGIRARRDRE